MYGKILAMIAALILVGTANSQETVKYTGAELAGTVLVTQYFGYPGSEPVSSFEPLDGNITGLFTLSRSLPMNGTTTVDAVGAFSNPGGIAPTYAFDSPFTFTTSNGAIVGWNVYANQCPCYGSEADSLSSTSGDSYSVNIGLSPDSEGVGFTFQGSASGRTPGTWTVTQAPEIDAGPAASAIALLLGGLAAALGRQRMGFKLSAN